MKYNLKKYLSLSVIVTVLLGMAGCVSMTVRQQDLDSWVGVSVEALDMHSFFMTIPMHRRVTDSGIEVRNYANTKIVENCFAYKSSSINLPANANGFCSEKKVGCNNIFYIKNRKVIEYAPTGQCFTDERVQPEKRYMVLGK